METAKLNMEYNGEIYEAHDLKHDKVKFVGDKLYLSNELGVIVFLKKGISPPTSFSCTHTHLSKK